MITNPLPDNPSEEEIVAFVENLNPRDARGNANNDNCCVTPLFTSVIVNSVIISLTLLLGKYLAIYVRVSSDEQKKNGYSVGDQVRRGIQYAIRRGLAFRIFTDASLSGWLPINEPQIVQEMLDMKAERYEEVFNSVFLNEYNTYSPSEKRQLEDYRNRHCEGIQAGIVSINEDPGAPKLKRRGQERRALAFRPALTVMFFLLYEIHEIAITDQTRLSRNYALTILLSRKLAKAKVHLYGLIEPIVRGRSAGERMVAVVLGQQAEMKLYEVCQGAMRGHERMLTIAKKPHASVPNWVIRDADGKAQFRVETEGKWEGQEARRMAIQRIIKLFLEGPDPGLRGTNKLAIAMIEEGYPDPTGKGWQTRTIHQMLTSRTLLGEQEIYGLRHKVLPAVCDERTFDRIQRRLHQRSTLSDYDGTIEGEVRIGTGLLRCVCGDKMVCTPSRNAYVCPKTLHTRLDKSVRHAVLKINDWHSFLDGVMTSHVIDMLVESAAGDDRSNAMQTALDLTREELALAIAEREEDIQIKLPEVKAGLAGMGIGEYDPAYETMKEKAVEAKVRPLTDKVARLETQLAEQQMAKDTYVPPVAFKDFGEQLTQWNTLCDSQKNSIIRNVFDEFRVAGTEPDQSVTPVRRTAINAQLPPIQLLVTRRGNNYLRRFPAAKEWARDLRRQLQGDEWFGEFRNFGWSEDIRGGDEDQAGVTTTVTVEPWEAIA